MVACLRVRVPKPAAAGQPSRPSSAPQRQSVQSPVSEESQFEEADIPFAWEGRRQQPL
jgi:hypothetical protein